MQRTLRGGEGQDTQGSNTRTATVHSLRYSDKQSRQGTHQDEDRKYRGRGGHNIIYRGDTKQYLKDRWMTRSLDTTWDNTRKEKEQNQEGEGRDEVHQTQTPTVGHHKGNRTIRGERHKYREGTRIHAQGNRTESQRRRREQHTT